MLDSIALSDSYLKLPVFDTKGVAFSSIIEVPTLMRVRDAQRILTCKLSKSQFSPFSLGNQDFLERIS